MEVWALPPPRGPFTRGSPSGPRGHTTCRPFPAAAVPPSSAGLGATPGCRRESWGHQPQRPGRPPRGAPAGGRPEGGRRSRDHCRKRGREQAGIELQKLQRREGVLRPLGCPCGCDPPTPRALSQHVHCPPLPAPPAPPGTRSPRRLPGQPDFRSTNRTRTWKRIQTWLHSVASNTHRS